MAMKYAFFFFLQIVEYVEIVQNCRIVRSIILMCQNAEIYAI